MINGDAAAEPRETTDTLTVGGEDHALTARLRAELTAFNNAAAGTDDERTISVRVSDAAGELVGGLIGWTWGDCAGIDLLWVRADRRGQGWGGRLLRAGEQQARRYGATRVMLSSLTFQAPGFYLRHGYTEVGRVAAIPGGNAQHHFVKDLTDPAQPPGPLLVALVELPADAVEPAQRYEDIVLALLGQHGGRLERRLRTADGRTEVHTIRFASRAGYESFLADPRRVALRNSLGDAAPVTRVLEVGEV